MLRLFTTFYDEQRADRREEYLTCLGKNLTCNAIAEIWVFHEGGDLPKDPGNKLHTRPCRARPLYDDIFALINELVSPTDISIIANTDIYFDERVGVLEHLDLGATCFALSRWNVEADGSRVLWDRNDSQDAWVFRGGIRDVSGAFPLGVPHCDNRMVYELQEAGYDVRNPSFSIRCFHLHSGIRGEYGEDPDFVDGPFRYIWPHNLFNPLKTILFNLAHPGPQVGYRVDRRKIARWFVCRAFNKLRGLLVASPE